MLFNLDSAASGTKRNKLLRLLKRYRYYLTILFSICCFILLCIFIILSPVSSKSRARDVVVTVPVQASANQVGRILKQSELVRSSLIFSLYARWTGMDSLINAGEYRISNSLSTPEVLKELVDGRYAAHEFTVPEGFTTAQVADLLVSKGLVDRDKFFAAVANEDFPYDFIQSLPKGDKRLEGYLFPDTYQVMRGSSEKSIIEMMLQRFEKEMKDLDYLNQAKAGHVSLHEAVTVASLIEREARIDEERPLIAGVIYNRLNRQIQLQLCATVEYALGTYKPKLYYKDLEIDSPYNTYRIMGLPPGPIAMPGRNSLLAAVRPAHTEYLYYVAKPDGSHAFAATLAEHEANQEMYESED
ncbi:MAG: endolytic transglycosylase MltG [Peptococcaceae bacterium]|nr:endolytic transglycosylase MltG [Peptococcaceae bacterium]